MKFLVDADTTLKDFYSHYREDEVVVKEVKSRYENLDLLPDSSFKKFENKLIYELKFTNKGGAVMPIIICWFYTDGSKEIERINAYIWRKNEFNVTKTFMKDKKVAAVLLDPYKETADIDESNNGWNLKTEPTKWEVFKAEKAIRGQSHGTNPMQKFKK